MKQRFIALTDIYRKPKDRQNEIDDVQSMIRLLLYANEIDIEGLIATSSFCYPEGGKPSDKAVILDLIDAYEQVLPNLRVHNPAYPDADALRRVTKCGVDVFGEAYGNGFAEERFSENEGARLIMDALIKADERPLWIGLWGGANTLAQAVWLLQREQSKEVFELTLKKLRIYAISDQDHAGRWLRETYGDRLFYIVSPSSGDCNPWAGREFENATWRGISGDFMAKMPLRRDKAFMGADRSLVTNRWIRTQVQGDSPLRRRYPLSKYSMEGDTPTFLGLIQNGLNDLEHPNRGGWGGRYEYGFPKQYPAHTPPEKFPVWTDTADTIALPDGKTVTNPFCTIYRFRSAYQNDFLARLIWSEESTYQSANHHPVIADTVPKTLSARPGETVTICAKGSYDPDGDNLSYRWWNYREAGTFSDPVTLTGEKTDTVRLTVPSVPGELHIILELTDNGSPSLTAYRRVSVFVQ